jgi:hypothetical protein
MIEEHYLIWSFERDAWWRPARSGYTKELAAAGRYSPREARDICLDADRYTKEQMEVMVPEEAAAKFAEAMRL